MPLILPRRSFLAGLAAALCAPAVVRASSLMPLRGAPLAPITLVSEDSLNYEYWVQDNCGNIVRRSGWELLAAPQGVYAPWLPTCDADGTQRLRPINEHQSGAFLRFQGADLRVVDFGSKFDTDPVITRLRREQVGLLTQVREAKHNAHPVQDSSAKVRSLG